MLGMFLLLAFLGGAASMFQAGVNSQLRNWVGHPVFAAFISFSVGAMVLFLCILIQRVPGPELSKLLKAPWWAWLGGVLGAFYVWTTIVVTPKIGAAALMSLVVTGQMIVSLALDHFGLLGLSRHPVNIWRFLGVLLLFLGVALIRGK